MPAVTASRLWETVGEQVRNTDGIDSDSSVCVVRSEEADRVVSDVIAGAARNNAAAATFVRGNFSLTVPPSGFIIAPMTNRSVNAVAAGFGFRPFSA